MDTNLRLPHLGDRAGHHFAVFGSIVCSVAAGAFLQVKNYDLAGVLARPPHERPGETV